MRRPPPCLRLTVAVLLLGLLGACRKEVPTPPVPPAEPTPRVALGTELSGVLL